MCVCKNGSDLSDSALCALDTGDGGPSTKTVTKTAYTSVRRNTTDISTATRTVLTTTTANPFTKTLTHTVFTTTSDIHVVHKTKTSDVISVSTKTNQHTHFTTSIATASLTTIITRATTAVAYETDVTTAVATILATLTDYVTLTQTVFLSTTRTARATTTISSNFIIPTTSTESIIATQVATTTLVSATTVSIRTLLAVWSLLLTPDHSFSRLLLLQRCRSLDQRRPSSAPSPLWTILLPVRSSQGSSFLPFAFSSEFQPRNSTTTVTVPYTTLVVISPSGYVSLRSGNYIQKALDTSTAVLTAGDISNAQKFWLVKRQLTDAWCYLLATA
jgi:hypothetical protein